jgi:hypothetical protein
MIPCVDRAPDLESLAGNHFADYVSNMSVFIFGVEADDELNVAIPSNI